MKCTGTIIRRTALTETSLIVTWCTAEHGLVKTVAKGARRPKSPFVGKLDLFFEAEFEVHRSKKSELHVLRDLALTNPRLGLRDSYLQTLAATYFAQLLDLVAEPEAPMTQLHDLIFRALGFLETQRPNEKAVIHFENELTESLGIRDPNRSAAAALADICRQLPKCRSELFELMQ